MASFESIYCSRCIHFGECDKEFVRVQGNHYMTNFNTKLIDYGNGKIQLKKYSNYVGKPKDKNNIPTCFQSNSSESEKSSCARTIAMHTPTEEEKEYLEKRSEKSLLNSVTRTKNNIYNLIRANNWEYFVTITFDSEKYDSTNYEEITKVLHNHMLLLRKTKCKNLKYVLIPEYHKDGKKFHFHALFSDTYGLTFVQAYNPHTGKMIIRNNKPVMNILEFNTIGFNSAMFVMDSAKTCLYMLKYITKDLCCTTKGKKRFWASRNLLKPTISEYNFPTEDFEESVMAISDSLGCEIEYASTKDSASQSFQQKVNYFELVKK